MAQKWHRTLPFFRVSLVIIDSLSAVSISLHISPEMYISFGYEVIFKDHAGAMLKPTGTWHSQRGNTQNM